MLKTANNVLFYVWWMFASGLVKLYHIPARVNNFLKDHIQLYRQLRGGVWLQWNGFWEKVDTTGHVIYYRGRVAFDAEEAEIYWQWKQALQLGDSDTTTEDYTKH